MPVPPPTFSPQVLMDLYLRGQHDALSEQLLAILRHFRDATYHTLDRQGQFFADAFVKHFLALFTQDDYVPRRDHLAAFVGLNPTIANLVAMSSFRTTDPYLGPLRNRSGPLGKVLTLLSARNAAEVDRRAIFDADPTLASLWFGAYAEAYRSGLIRDDVCQRLREHFAFEDDRLDIRYGGLDGYFASTYVGNGSDRALKPVLNRAVRRFLNGVRITNRPDPSRRKVAVLSGNWSPIHSAYRITAGYVAALAEAGYHLTLIPLGRRDFDARHFHEIRPIGVGPDGAPDLTPLLDNDFHVAYFPDVGMSPLSILLANLRIAPVQVASLGHSVSTLGAEIDYFLSGADVEPAEHPERNYSERLVLLPGCGAVHERPDYTRTGHQKADPDVVLINAPWTAPKLNHALALTLRALIRRSERAVLLRLFVSHSLSRGNDYLPFVRDLEALLGAEHVEVILGRPYQEYMVLMEEGDFSLDSFPFGGCNTVVDSLFLHKPILCREGDHWYNRIGPRILRMVGLPELVATSDQDYIDMALRLIHDDTFRAGLRERLERADLDATLFRQAEASDFVRAITYLTENYTQLRHDPDRVPIWIER